MQPGIFWSLLTFFLTGLISFDLTLQFSPSIFRTYMKCKFLWFFSGLMEQFSVWQVTFSFKASCDHFAVSVTGGAPPSSSHSVLDWVGEVPYMPQNVTSPSMERMRSAPRRSPPPHCILCWAANNWVLPPTLVKCQIPRKVDHLLVMCDYGVLIVYLQVSGYWHHNKSEVHFQNKRSAFKINVSTLWNNYGFRICVGMLKKKRCFHIFSLHVDFQQDIAVYQYSFSVKTQTHISGFLSHFYHVTQLSNKQGHQGVYHIWLLFVMEGLVGESGAVIEVRWFRGTKGTRGCLIPTSSVQ